MSIQISQLFNDILKDYGCRLLTSDFFGRSVGWVHVQEDRNFVKYLHGGELILNSSMTKMDDEGKIEFIKGLIRANVAGVVMATDRDKLPSDSIVQFCEDNHFPLIWADYQVPYLDIVHSLTEVLVYEERNAINREVAFRNILLYHGKDELHTKQIDTDPYFGQKEFVVAIAGYKDSSNGVTGIKSLLNKVTMSPFFRGVICEEVDRVVMLVSGASNADIWTIARDAHKENDDLHISMGIIVHTASGIYESYKTALAAYRMIPVLGQNPLSYTNLGIYRFLDSVDEDAAHNFIDLTLGKLIRYDKANGTDYVQLLRTFLKNECNVIQTAAALYFHRNTVKKKITAINEILGCDVMLNENRFRIILALYLLKVQSK